mgnify:CR=1 FL=1
MQNVFDKGDLIFNFRRLPEKSYRSCLKSLRLSANTFHVYNRIILLPDLTKIWVHI